ncbi:MAG: DUF1800 family protein, partial [Verrucomicrobiales bacterium]
SSAGGDREQFVRLMTGANPAGGLGLSSEPGTPSPELAARFLFQASLGPSDAEIKRVRKLGYAKWIEDQLGKKATLLQPYIAYLQTRRDTDIEEHPTKFAYNKIKSAGNNIGHRNSSTAWMRAALGGDDHLRQRVAWSLSQILVVANNGVNIATEGYCNYYDLLLNGAFGSYQDLLLEVSLHPIMGRYLSHLGNRKANPAINRYRDENYAREIMQLFSIGLWELNPDGTRHLDQKGEPIPTYSNEDIQTLARVFTGLGLEGEKFGRNNWKKFRSPMVMDEKQHDLDAKRALGGRIDLPAGRAQLEDIEDTVAALVAHPSTAPFISRRLINHLVSSNPSPAYVERVVAAWNESQADLGAVLTAILLDPEARGPRFLADPHFGRLKGPILRTTAVLRAFRGGENLGKGPRDYPGLQWWSPSPWDSLQQEPLRSPSVFNFYEAVYQRPGAIADEKLLSPEFQILNDVTAATVPNYLWMGISESFHDLGPRYPGKPLRCNFARERKLAADDLGALLDRCNLLLTAGTMSAETRAALARHLRKVKKPGERALLAVYGAAVSPQSAILR